MHNLQATYTPQKPLPVFSKFKYNANSVKFLDLLLSYNPSHFNGHKIQARLYQHKEYYLHPLLFAAKVGYLELVACLVRHGISLETVCFSGMTPLHYAAEKGYKTVVKYLLAHGANIHTVNRCGKTPLHLLFYNKMELTQFHFASSSLAPTREPHPGLTPCVLLRYRLLLERILPARVILFLSRDALLLC